MVKLAINKHLPEVLSSDSDDSDLGEPLPVKQSVPSKTNVISKPQKIVQQQIARSDSVDDDDVEIDEDEIDSDLEIAAQDDQSDEEELNAEKKFGQRGVNEEERLKVRLQEIRANFYNRLSSQKLIKNTKGRIPFTEHMTITNDKPLMVPDALAIHDDIKREIAFYNMTRENVKKGMEILVQAKIPISRPDDFFAEMLKSDEHMAKVKSRLLQQQQKIQTFEEKKQRMENKKFHKAIKAYKQTEKHKEKRHNVEQINTLKKRIADRKGGDVDEKEFNKIFNGGERAQQQGRGGHRGGGNFKGGKKSVIDRVKEGQHNKRRGGSGGPGGNKSGDKWNSKSNFSGKSKGIHKKGGNNNNKRPGKMSRQHKRR